MPLADLVIVQVQKFQVAQSLKDQGAREAGDLVVGQVDLFEVAKGLEIHHILEVNSVALQVSDV